MSAEKTAFGLDVALRLVVYNLFFVCHPTPLNPHVNVGGGVWRGVSGLRKNRVFGLLLIPSASLNIDMGVQGGANSLPLVFLFPSTWFIQLQRNSVFSQTPDINPVWCAIPQEISDPGWAKVQQGFNV